jgi:hypothetical protein
MELIKKKIKKQQLQLQWKKKKKRRNLREHSPNPEVNQMIKF